MGKENFKDRFTKLRLKNNWTQRQIAKWIGVTPGYISQIESGLSDNLRSPILESLARVFKVNAEWLKTGKGSPEDPALEQTISNRELDLIENMRNLSEEAYLVIEKLVIYLVSYKK